MIFNHGGGNGNIASSLITINNNSSNSYTIEFTNTKNINQTITIDTNNTIVISTVRNCLVKITKGNSTTAIIASEDCTVTISASDVLTVA